MASHCHFQTKTVPRAQASCPRTSPAHRSSSKLSGPFKSLPASDTGTRVPWERALNRAALTAPAVGQGQRQHSHPHPQMTEWAPADPLCRLTCGLVQCLWQAANKNKKFQILSISHDAISIKMDTKQHSGDDCKLFSLYLASLCMSVLWKEFQILLQSLRQINTHCYITMVSYKTAMSTPIFQRPLNRSQSSRLLCWQGGAESPASS